MLVKKDMKNAIVLLLVVFSTSITLSQHELTLKFSPQNVLYPLNSMVPLALEYNKGCFGVEYEHGIMINPPLIDLDWNLGKSNLKYFRSQISFRYYLKLKLKTFIGLTTSYLPSRYERNHNWYWKEGSQIIYEKANVFVQQFKFRFISGIKIPTKSRLNFELITGIGFRYNKVTYTGMNETLASPLDDLWDEWLSPRDRVEGGTFRPSLLICVRVGFKLFSSFTDQENVE